MKSHYSSRFDKLLAQLPARTRDLAEKAFQQFERDPSHNSLDFKLLKGHKPFYRARVGDHYRAIGRKEGDVIIWTWIGSHEDYNKIIKKLK